MYKKRSDIYFNLEDDSSSIVVNRELFKESLLKEFNKRKFINPDYTIKIEAHSHNTPDEHYVLPRINDLTIDSFEKTDVYYEYFVTNYDDRIVYEALGGHEDKLYTFHEITYTIMK